MEGMGKVRYIVHGVEQRIVSLEIEADSEEEAFAEAEGYSSDQYDVWDTDIFWSHAMET
jgi:hypothetical protein